VELAPNDDQPVVELIKVENGWLLRLPGSRQPVFCKRLADRDDVVFAALEELGDREYRSAWPYKYRFPEGDFDIGCEGPQRLIAAEAWGFNDEVLLVLDDHLAPDLTIHRVIHNAVIGDHVERLTLDRPQVEWLQGELESASRLLPHWSADGDVNELVRIGDV
jgi:hypothetical protein